MRRPGRLVSSALLLTCRTLGLATILGFRFRLVVTVWVATVRLLATTCILTFVLSVMETVLRVDGCNGLTTLISVITLRLAIVVTGLDIIRLWVSLGHMCFLKVTICSLLWVTLLPVRVNVVRLLVDGLELLGCYVLVEWVSMILGVFPIRMMTRGVFLILILRMAVTNPQVELNGILVSCGHL